MAIFKVGDIIVPNGKVKSSLGYKLYDSNLKLKVDTVWYDYEIHCTILSGKTVRYGSMSYSYCKPKIGDCIKVTSKGFKLYNNKSILNYKIY